MFCCERKSDQSPVRPTPVDFSLLVREQVLPIEDEDALESESGNKLESEREKIIKVKVRYKRQSILPGRGANVAE